MTGRAIRITAVPRSENPNSGLQAMHFAACYGDEVWAIPAAGSYLGDETKITIFSLDNEAAKSILPLRLIRLAFMAALFVRCLVRPRALYFVHSFSFSLPLYLLGREYYIFIHGSDRRFLETRWGKAVARRAGGVFGVGFGVHRPDLTVEEVPNIFIPAPAGAPTAMKHDVLFVLRNAPVKNPLYPLDLAEQLGKRLNLSILVAGVAVDELALSERERLGRLQEQGCEIRYVGRKSYDEVVQMMRESRTLFIPSLSEGVPKVLLEAMSQGMHVAMNDRLNLPSPLSTWGEPVDLVDWNAVASMIERSRASGRCSERIRRAHGYLEQSQGALRRLYDGIYKRQFGFVPGQARVTEAETVNPSAPEPI